MNRNHLQQLVDNFVDQLLDLCREEVLSAFSQGGGGRGRLLNGANHGVSGRGKGEKRTSGELDQLAEKFVEFVAKNPSLRIEQINKQLGTTTKTLALPIRKLIAEKRLKVKGEKRATTYFAT